jgi:hypothetical protein
MIETMRSDDSISGSNRTSVAVRHSSTETTTDDFKLEEKQ